jgi:hypothetical protein
MHEVAAEEIRGDSAVAAEPPDQRRDRVKLVEEPCEMVFEVVVGARQRVL